jgi:peptidoglycan-N-acetylglucosamine deacetylase
MNRRRFARRPLWPRASWAKDHSKILFTFDDGPTEQTTPKVLEVLAEFGVRAVFFQIGERIQRHPELAKMVLEQGHVIGNHSQTHSILKPWQFRPAWREVAQCQETCERELGFTPKLFRPALGKLTPGFRWATRRLGLQIAGWSLDSNDWKCRSEEDAERCSEEFLEAIQPGDVVLLHDANPFCPQILERILPSITQSTRRSAKQRDPLGPPHPQHRYGQG